MNKIAYLYDRLMERGMTKVAAPGDMGENKYGLLPREDNLAALDRRSKENKYGLQQGEDNLAALNRRYGKAPVDNKKRAVNPYDLEKIKAAQKNFANVLNDGRFGR